jgi:hypothetical protein
MTVKFNQYWRIDPEKSPEYEKYVLSKFICEGRVDEAHKLLESLQSSKFQKAKKELKQFVENYETRILTFHIQKVDGYKSQSYQLVAG